MLQCSIWAIPDFVFRKDFLWCLGDHMWCWAFKLWVVEYKASTAASDSLVLESVQPDLSHQCHTQSSTIRCCCRTHDLQHKVTLFPVLYTACPLYPDTLVLPCLRQCLLPHQCSRLFSYLLLLLSSLLCSFLMTRALTFMVW